MKRLTAFFLLAFLALSAGASTITWQTTNWLALGASPTAVTITQVGDTPFSSGNFIIVGLPKKFTGSAGTNIMAQGMYRLDLAGFTFAKPFYFVVPDDNNVYNVAQLRGTNAPTIPTITPAPVVPASVPSTISFFLTNFCQSIAPPAAITLTQLGDAPLSDGNLIIVGLPRRVTSTSPGQFSASLFPSYYRMDVDGLTYAKPYLFVVPAGGTNYNAAQLRVTNTAPSLVPNLYALVSALLTNLSGAGLWLPDGSGGMSNAFGPVTVRSNMVWDTSDQTHFQVTIQKDGVSTNLLDFRPAANQMHFFGNFVADAAIHGGNGIIADAGAFIGSGGFIALGGQFVGDGGGLTNLNVPAPDPNTLTNNYAGTITATAFSGNGAALTGIPESGVTSLVSDLAGKQAGPLTGDVTTSGAGSTATTLAKGNAGNLDSGTLLAARMPALTGDITTSAGSVATTLKNTGTAGTGYTKVNTDAQGRVTSGTTLSASDVPAIPESGVTSLVSDLAGKQAGPLTGDVTTSGAAATLATVATPGTSTKLTYNSKGLVTSGTSATLASADYANQGTTTTVLHGNASGNPSFAAVDVSSAEITGTLKAGAFPALTGDVTTSAGSLTTTLAAGNAGNLNSGTLGTARLPTVTTGPYWLHPWVARQGIVIPNPSSNPNVLGEQFVTSFTGSGTTSVGHFAPGNGQGCYFEIKTQATAGSTARVSGFLGTWHTGANILMDTRCTMTALGNNRVYICLSDQNTGLDLTSDNPAGNYAAFMATTNSGAGYSSTKWVCITKDNTTQATTVATGSGATIDTNPHRFTIQFNDSIPNVIFYIDAVAVATNTTHLPGSVNLQYAFNIASTTTQASTLQVEYNFIQADH